MTSNIILRLVDNSTTELRELLCQQLLSAQASDIHVAFLLSSGIQLLEPEIQHFLRKGRTLRVLAGGDFGLTEPEALLAFSERLYYLRLLLSAPGEVPSEQLLAAHVRQAYRQRGEDREWLERAAREIAALLKHDYERLMTVLYAIELG